MAINSLKVSLNIKIALVVKIKLRVLIADNFQLAYCTRIYSSCNVITNSDRNEDGNERFCNRCIDFLDPRLRGDDARSRCNVTPPPHPAGGG